MKYSMKNKHRDEIIRLIKYLSGAYSLNEVFSDFVMCTAISIQNSCNLIHNNVWKEREEKYKKTVHKYELDIFREMFAQLVMAYDEDISDILGDIYMNLNLGRKGIKQYFTPDSLTALMVEIEDKNNDKDIIKIHEPAVGSGGMIIAYALQLKNKGINYQEKLKVLAQDLDWKAVYMSYIQFSLLGIDATVVQGDTLIEPYSIFYPRDRVFYTPKNLFKGIFM